MRKVFAQVYELLGRGYPLEEIGAHLKGSGSKSYGNALEHFRQMLGFDSSAFGETPVTLLGMDEVGRGPLAGPLVAVCIDLPSPPELPFLRDSKKLTHEERLHLVPLIKKAARRFGVGVVEPEEFGRDLNLHHLTFLAMSRAVESAGFQRERETCGLLVDGKFPLPSWKGLQRAVIKGDDRSLRIAAASVVAKVHRDEIMLGLARRYPQYQFETNVGYGTQAHRQALLEYGPCPAHRPNFLSRILSEGIPSE